HAPLGDFQKQYNRSVITSKGYKEKFIAPLARILVVDDNAMNLAVAQDLLKKTRLQVDVASSGEECLEILKHKEYHLICMDHMMPVMDGVQTMHAIREMDGNPSRDIPIIALTANAVVGAREFYLEEGFEDYLTKPIEPEKLEDMMIKYLPKELVYLSGNAKEAEGEEAEEDTISMDEESLINMGINFSHGLKYMGGSRALYAKVLHDFRDMLSEKEEQLKSMISKGDVYGYAIIVHALKGNARNVGADELAEEAFDLEKKSKEGQLEEVEVRSPILFSMMQTLGENLSKYFNKNASDVKEKAVEKTDEKLSISEAEWKKKLEILNQQLDDFDGDGAAQTLKELKNCNISEKDKKALRMCEKALNDFAYDVAMDVLASILKS
ncbi:MAG: response regulator, partial [Lachnospiraceae bacterium]|nr:response regulator [Lachnospiraceae bacterium]